MSTSFSRGSPVFPVHACFQHMLNSRGGACLEALPLRRPPYTHASAVVAAVALPNLPQVVGILPRAVAVKCSCPGCREAANIYVATQAEVDSRLHASDSLSVAVRSGEKA